MYRSMLVLATCISLSACGQQTPSAAIVDGQALPAKTLSDYRAEAAAATDSISVADAKALVGDESVVFVDIREGAEIAASGTVKGAIHVPRGYLEFFIDSGSSMHIDEFSSGKKIILYCETGGRSLLATKLAVDMGLSDAVYLDGGFRAWTRAGGEVATLE